MSGECRRLVIAATTTTTMTTTSTTSGERCGLIIAGEKKLVRSNSHHLGGLLQLPLHTATLLFFGFHTSTSTKTITPPYFYCILVLLILFLLLPQPPSPTAPWLPTTKLTTVNNLLATGISQCESSGKESTQRFR